MGYRDYPSFKKTSIWADNNALMMLIIINVMVFILLHFLRSVYGLSGLSQDLFMKNTYPWFTLPADLSSLAQRPWTLVSAMFTQMNTWLLLSSLFWLWTFGYILQDLTGNRKIIPLYLYGGFAAVVVFLLSFNLIPQLKGIRDTSVMLGAAPSVMAIAVAATTVSPNYRIFPMIGGGIPLWAITAAFVILDFAAIGRVNGMFLPHIASALVGFFYARALLNGNDWGAWMNNLYDRVTNLFNPERKKPRRNPVRQEVFYNTRGKQPFKKTTHITQQKVDEILDKISQRGYDRLTDEEKELLRRASEEDL
jgi:membrane associated rhomboid family serine protease